MMDKSGADAYVYAKASGMLGRSFIRERAEKLFEAKSLSELWDLIFDEPVPVIPENLLAGEIERQSVKKFVNEYISLLDVYDKPEEFLIELIRSYDILNLKVVLASVANKEEKCPRLVDLGKYSKLNLQCWPNIEKITENSEFYWIKKAPKSAAERQRLENQLDLLEFQIRWNKLQFIKDESRSSMLKYYKNDYSIKNLLWALRLKVYYNFTRSQILENLYFVGDSPSKIDPLCSYAFEILDKDPTDYQDWVDWRFSDYLNFHEEGGVWKIDPRWIEQKFRQNEITHDLTLFHQFPMTSSTLAMFYKIKKQELNCIRASCEGLRLGADKKEIMYAAGLSSDTL